MSNYQFAPAPTFGRSEHDFVTWNDAFTAEELDRIIEIGESLGPKEATLGSGGDTNNCIRVSDTSWVPCNGDTQWLYDRLAFVARQLNGQFYGFDLYGFSEDMQYTVYRGSEEDGGHYTWHLDRGPNAAGAGPRKFTMVTQLSDPGEYEGGELQIQSGAEPMTVDKCRGRIVAFPSYMLHRVTPVTKGLRRTLVVWITGPAFR